MVNKLLKYLPGIGLMLVVGYAGKIVAGFVPRICSVCHCHRDALAQSLPSTQIFAPGLPAMNYG